MIINLFTRTFLCSSDYKQVDKKQFPSFNFITMDDIYKDYFENKEENNGKKFKQRTSKFQITYIYNYMKKNGFLSKYSYNFIICKGNREYNKLIFRYAICLGFMDYDRYGLHLLYALCRHFNKWKYILDHDVFKILDCKNDLSTYNSPSNIDHKLYFGLLGQEDYKNKKYDEVRFDPDNDQGIIKALPSEYFVYENDDEDNPNYVCKRFEMFYYYEFIEQLVQYQYELFNKGLETPNWLQTLYDEYEKSGYSELALYFKNNPAIVKKILDENIFRISKYTDLKDYAMANDCTYGYTDLNHFKFNRILRDTVYEERFVIG